jgi:hypothetical protein
MTLSRLTEFRLETHGTAFWLRFTHCDMIPRFYYFSALRECQNG